MDKRRREKGWSGMYGGSGMKERSEIKGEVK
jgi:hypothetical protein